jgi:hypothetical protein
MLSASGSDSESGAFALLPSESGARATAGDTGARPGPAPAGPGWSGPMPGSSWPLLSFIEDRAQQLTPPAAGKPAAELTLPQGPKIPHGAQCNLKARHACRRSSARRKAQCSEDARNSQSKIRGLHRPYAIVEAVAGVAGDERGEV